MEWVLAGDEAARRYVKRGRDGETTRVLVKMRQGWSHC